jgi:hypothetical protein
MPENDGGPGSLERVLATEGKTPLKDAATSSPQRSDKTADRSKVARNRIIAGIVVAVIAIVAIFLLTRGGGSPASSETEPPPGAVDFQSKGITFVPYQLHGDQNAQKATAHEAATKIRLALDALFQTAYVATDTWGDTGQIKDFFTAGAQPALEGDVGTLTLGENAGDTYDRVDPVKKKSTIVVNVLTDAKGNAARASARISFVGTATRTDGTTSTITVTGTVILVPDGDTWKIEAYRLNRSEKPTQAASTSPTAEAS